ncbi:hypothetical protein GCM10007350_21900 [Jeongeupia chitinilytica]|uniref:Four helix bundle protein n=2 Tax=Jeongeupia chitinilytica TaxID=1041641 RepID=A0ABQ3H083_9NEIS|nr:hypothetical protein GCM10007350_21900 [Jeongeupia chitinilytica]
MTKLDLVRAAIAVLPEPFIAAQVIRATGDSHAGSRMRDLCRYGELVCETYVGAARATCQYRRTARFGLDKAELVVLAEQQLRAQISIADWLLGRLAHIARRRLAQGRACSI